MTAEPLELVGILVACGSAAAALVLDDRRLRWVAMAVALAAAPLLVLGNVWDEARVVDFRESPAQVVAALVFAAVAVAGLAAAFSRWPEAFAATAFAVLPLRVPIEVGGETANLLVPLYAVIAGGLVAYGLRMRRGDVSGRARADRSGPTRWLTLALAATLVLYGVQAAYSEDVSNAIENVGFFVVPFAVMFVLLLEVRWRPRLLGRVLIAIAAVAAVCSLIAVYQWLVRDLWLNPELFDANQLHQYFRVNSIFFDPNILGRYLALAITAVGAYISWNNDRRVLALALAICTLMLLALAFSFSITSFAAVLAGLGTVALLRWGWRGAAIAAGIGFVCLVALLIAGGPPTSDIQSDRGIDSGRSDLISGGIDLAAERPLAGWGSGAFGAAFVAEIDSEARSAVSHSEPITVASEQGVVGLAVYAALIASALLVLLGGGAGRSAARTTVAAGFVAMLVHSLGYAGFIIDPATWALLALGLALRRDPPEPAATMRS